MQNYDSRKTRFAKLLSRAKGQLAPLWSKPSLKIKRSIRVCCSVRLCIPVTWHLTLACKNQPTFQLYRGGESGDHNDCFQNGIYVDRGTSSDRDRASAAKCDVHRQLQGQRKRRIPAVISSCAAVVPDSIFQFVILFPFLIYRAVAAEVRLAMTTPENVTIITPPRKEVSSHLGDLNVIAIENAYATCHNVQDLLHLRGFTSKPAYVKNKRGKTKKRKLQKDKN
ncbi:uncharacterized protein LOC123474727 [Daphnia magna]|uniref:uncharacterized protein LOC123474727 n=1 Tax=Daphnia magna TaxID=35525 RepID=UPI001E1BD2FF|nr:uncharacterized protein LOC123474727 [Daphnia magna]